MAKRDLDPNKDKIEKITDVYGNTLTYLYNNVKGITTITDLNGRKTIQNHDNSFNITKSIDTEDKTTAAFLLFFNLRAEDITNPVYGKIKCLLLGKNY